MEDFINDQITKNTTITDKGTGNIREIDELEGDELLELAGSTDYIESINKTLKYLNENKSTLLTSPELSIYSPKFLAMLDLVKQPDELWLVYSQFRMMEGIGIFALVLEANGFSRFAIRRTGGGGWEIDMPPGALGKPAYALYTGTEDEEERGIIRLICNGEWENVPDNISKELKKVSPEDRNKYGGIIKVFMITSAGSEGINLRNVRKVAIMEPYWNNTRLEQIVGRARRICSHSKLPLNLQTVEVYIFVTVFTQAQLKSEYAKELIVNDVSKISPYAPQTTDQKLLEVALIKERLTSQLIKGIKESSIDCATHSQSNNAEGLVCLSFGNPSVNEYSYAPNYLDDASDAVAALNINAHNVEWEAFKLTMPDGRVYAFRKETNQVYDLESVEARHPILVGTLITKEDDDGNKIQYIERVF